MTGTITEQKWDELEELLKATQIDSGLVCETALEQELEEFLKSLAGIQATITRKDALVYSSYHELVLRHGEIFKYASRPAKYRKLPHKQCFSNSFHMSMHKGLRYAEGYAVSSVGVPVHHAWNLDEDGIVVDTTWDDGSAYAGIAFDSEEVAKIIIAKGSHGIFDDYENGHILLKEKFDKEKLVAFYEGI